MVDLAVLPGFLLATFLLCAAPGPDQAFIVAIALDRGPRAGVLSATGMACGMVVWATATALGLAAVMHSVPVLFDMIRLAGAGYLLWMGATTLLALRGKAQHGAHAASTDAGVVRRALLTDLTNPKVAIIFIAFLPEFVRSGSGPVAVQLVTLGAVFVVVGLCVDSAVGLAAGRLHSLLRPGGSGARALSMAAAATFLALAVLLVADVAH